MKTGKTLVDLANVLERQSIAKKDFIASTSFLEMTPGGEITLATDSTCDAQGSMVCNRKLMVADHTHSQIAARLDILAKYYNRMKVEAPELLAANVNQWFHQKPERRMLRTLDGQMRDYLSDRSPGITEEQAKKVLLMALHKHDAENGITWDTLRYWSNEVKKT